MEPARAIPSPLKRYAVALSFCAAAILIGLALRPRFGGQTPLTPFTVAVILSAAYGGAGPGLLVTGISGLCAYLLFGGSVVSLIPTGQPRLPLFFLIGIIISVVLERLRRSNAELASAKAKLESANHELSRRSEALAHSNEELQRFAYALSHDLQTPLRTVGMFTERLAANRQIADEDEATSMRFIQEGVESMRAMIGGLLEYATASHTETERGVADVNTVLKTVLQDLRSQIEESGAEVHADVLPVVEGDGTRIRQLLQNLISNAIKYRGENRPEIFISATAGPGGWTFCVRDNGIGIDMRYAEKIFRLFERLHPGSTHRGAGIGLAVCRGIVERHGGRIWVESEPGKGSSFLFTLPASRNR
jgi:light-regulated signal transduction histidine kinase (bacteriophytochrome)